MKVKEFLALLFAGSFIVSTAAWSDDDDDQESELSIGLGLGKIDDSLYDGGESDAEIVPALKYRSGRFFIDGLSVGYDLYGQDNLTLYSAISFDLSGERDDSDDLDDMDDFDTATSLELGAEWETPNGNFEIELASDISDTHDGTQVGLGYSYPVRLESMWVSFGVEANWLSGDYGDYYYGVDADEVRPGRPEYEVDDTWVYGINAGALYPIDKNWSFTAGVSVEFYEDEITDSPIVVEDQVTQVFTAISYTF